MTQVPDVHLSLIRAIGIMSVALLLIVLSGCGTDHGPTSVTWHPQAPIGIFVKPEQTGLYKVTASVPVAGAVDAAMIAATGDPAAGFLPISSLGVFSINHNFDCRPTYTYIVVRNRTRGTDQVFQIGATGYVDVSGTGKYDFHLYAEGDNKFVIEDESPTATMFLKFYPQGEERGSVTFDEGPNFVFLTDRRVHIEYPSIQNAVLSGSASRLSLGSLFRSDDTLSLDSISDITHVRSFRTNVLRIDWKPGIQNPPLEISLPYNRDGALNAEIGTLQSDASALDKPIRFHDDVSTDGTGFSIALSIVCAIGIVLSIGMCLKGSESGCALLFLCSMGLIGVSVYLYQDQTISDMAWANIRAAFHVHLWLFIVVAVVAIILMLRKSSHPSTV